MNLDEQSLECRNSLEANGVVKGSVLVFFINDKQPEKTSESEEIEVDGMTLVS
jgi:hypothetical protein